MCSELWDRAGISCFPRHQQLRLHIIESNSGAENQESPDYPIMSRAPLVSIRL